VVVEAQAAGLPCVISDALPEEIDVVPGLIHRLPLDAGPARWAEHILQLSGAPAPSPDEAYRAVCASDFDIGRSMARLCEVYDLAPQAGCREREHRCRG